MNWPITDGLCLTSLNHDQRHKYHHPTKTLKMTTTQAVKTSVSNNSLSQDYPHRDDHAKQLSLLVLCKISMYETSLDSVASGVTILFVEVSLPILPSARLRSNSSFIYHQIFLKYVSKLPPKLCDH